MMPMSAETNAMNGRMVFSTVSIVSRPAWKNTAMTDPMPMPIRAKRPSDCSLILREVS